MTEQDCYYIYVWRESIDGYAEEVGMIDDYGDITHDGDNLMLFSSPCAAFDYVIRHGSDFTENCKFEVIKTYEE